MIGKVDELVHNKDDETGVGYSNLSGVEEDEELTKREEELKKKAIFSKSADDLESILNKMRDEMIKNFYDMNIGGSKLKKWKAKINVILSKMRRLSFDDAEKMYVSLQRGILEDEYTLKDRVYAEGKELGEKKENLYIAVRDLDDDLLRLDKIIEKNQTKLEEVNQVMHYRDLLKTNKDAEKPERLTKIILEDYLNKSERSIASEKGEIRDILHNAKTEYEQEEDQFKEFDQEYKTLDLSLKIKHSQYTKQQQRIDKLKGMLDFMHHKYLNGTIISTIKQMKENNKNDKKAAKVVNARSKDSEYYGSNSINYEQFVVQVIKRLETPMSQNIRKIRNFHKEDLGKVVNDISSLSKQYSGKRSEEIEKRREFYRNKDTDNSDFF